MGNALQYRVFIALPLRAGNETLTARNVLLEALSGERISWVDPANFHITLRFLGDTPVSSLTTISNALQDSVILPEKSLLHFSGPGLFGPRGRPKVIYLGFQEDPVIWELHRQVEYALGSCGIPPMEDSFRPHLTLGRVKAIRDLKGVYDGVDRVKRSFLQTVQAERLVLYRSELTGWGPKYTPLWSRDFPG